MVLKVNYFRYSNTILNIEKKRVALNRQTSGWRKIMSGVPQGLVLGPLLFLVYINDLPDEIYSLCKIFADDTSLFSKVYYINKSVSELNANLEEKSYGAYQWKMQFNPDPNKQAHQVIFSRKQSSNNLSYPPIKFNNIDIFFLTYTIYTFSKKTFKVTSYLYIWRYLGSHSRSHYKIVDREIGY